MLARVLRGHRTVPCLPPYRYRRSRPPLLIVVWSGLHCVPLRNGTQWRPLHKTMSRGGRDRRYRYGGRHGTVRGPRSTRASIQVIFFGVGGLIHAAVGLAGGIGAFLTNRSGFVTAQPTP